MAHYWNGPERLLREVRVSHPRISHEPLLNVGKVCHLAFNLHPDLHLPRGYARSVAGIQQIGLEGFRDWI